jgi:hypothetical protein
VTGREADAAPIQPSGTESALTSLHACLTRPALRAIPNEPDQLPRLQEFQAAHPDVIIGTGEFSTWQARIHADNGETVTTRCTLKDLLDKLDSLLDAAGRPGKQARKPTPRRAALSTPLPRLARGGPWWQSPRGQDPVRSTI